MSPVNAPALDPSVKAPAAPAPSWEARNVVVLKVFGPVLVAAGVLGFVLPPSMSLMSGAPAYDVFHIAFGLLGTALAFKGTARQAALFNLGFGLVDLYQAVASVASLPPKGLFAYRPADDVLHVVLGLALAGVGFLGLRGAARERA